MDLIERNEDMRDFFNRKSEGYDEVHEQFLTTKNQLIDAVDPNARKVLDLGAGTGLELIHLYEVNKEARTTVIDVSENMLEKLKQRSFSDKLDIICGDFFKVEFGNGYDAVISTSSLHHFLQKDKLVLYKKIYDSLRVGGSFINSDKVAITNEEEQELLRDYYQNKGVKAHIDTPLSIEHEVEVLTQVGFKDIEVETTEKDNYRLIKARK